MIGCVSGSIAIKRYKHAVASDPSVLDRECELTGCSTVALMTGEFQCLAAWSDVSELDGDGVVLTLQSALCHTTRWAYSRETLKPVALVAAERSLGRIEDALQMLSRVGTTEHASICEVFLRHQSHSVRWEAVRAASVLGHPDLRRLIEQAAQDPHPDVRGAAVAALPSLVEKS
jgi:hypothetical protein